MSSVLPAAGTQSSRSLSIPMAQTVNPPQDLPLSTEVPFPSRQEEFSVMALLDNSFRNTGSTFSSA